jgi:hypothetical protein
VGKLMTVHLMGEDGGCQWLAMEAPRAALMKRSCGLEEKGEPQDDSDRKVEPGREQEEKAKATGKPTRKGCTDTAGPVEFGLALAKRMVQYRVL